MQHPIFRPHGVYSLNVDGRILVMRAQGPWNAEFSRQYGEGVRDLAVSLAGSPWALLGVVSQEGVHPPDSYSAQLDIIREHRKSGRVATAVVFHYIDSPQIAQRVFSKMYTEAGEPHAFFDDEESARQWLEEKLLAAKESS